MTQQFLHDVLEAKLLEGYQLWVSFDDGTSGIVDFTEWQPFPGVLSPLSDMEVFKQVSIHPEHKTLAWPTEIPIDVDPVWLYCRANDLELPQWNNFSESA